jgi:UDP-N-acetyl-L-fucosamine synthase
MSMTIVEKKWDEPNEQIHFLKPFGIHDFLHLQQNARCAISYSGTFSEEPALLNFPAITLRNFMEDQDLKMMKVD